MYYSTPTPSLTLQHSVWHDWRRAAGLKDKGDFVNVNLDKFRSRSTSRRTASEPRVRALLFQPQTKLRSAVTVVQLQMRASVYSTLLPLLTLIPGTPLAFCV